MYPLIEKKQYIPSDSRMDLELGRETYPRKPQPWWLALHKQNPSCTENENNTQLKWEFPRAKITTRKRLRRYGWKEQLTKLTFSISSMKLTPSLLKTCVWPYPKLFISLLTKSNKMFVDIPSPIAPNVPNIISTMSSQSAYFKNIKLELLLSFSISLVQQNPNLINFGCVELLIVECVVVVCWFHLIGGRAREYVNIYRSVDAIKIH